MRRQAPHLPRTDDQLHSLDCTCGCNPDADAPLTPNAIAGWMLAGVGFGNAVAFLLDPHAAADALLTAVGLR